MGCEERKKKIAWCSGKNGVAISRDGEACGKGTLEEEKAFRSALLALRSLLDTRVGRLGGQ